MEGQNDVGDVAELFHLLVNMLGREEQCLGQLSAHAMTHRAREAIAHVGRTAADGLQHQLGDDGAQIVLACGRDALLVVERVVQAHRELLLVQAARRAQIGARSSEAVALVGVEELLDAVVGFDGLLDHLARHLALFGACDELVGFLVDDLLVLGGEV